MTFYDMICFAKLFSRIPNGNMTMTDMELEVAAKMLKDLGDSSPNWTPMQKDLYKAMVDATKEGIRG